MLGHYRKRLHLPNRPASLVLTALFLFGCCAMAQEHESEDLPSPARQEQLEEDRQAVITGLQQAIRLLEANQGANALPLLRRLLRRVEDSNTNAQQSMDADQRFMKNLEEAVRAGTLTREQAHQQIRDYHARKLRAERRAKIRRPRLREQSEPRPLPTQTLPHQQVERSAEASDSQPSGSPDTRQQPQSTNSNERDRRQDEA